MLRDLILPLEAVCFLASLFLYTSKQVPLYLKYFPVFLFITVIIETIGTLLKELGFALRPMFNYFTVSEFVFYFFVLYQIMPTARIRKTILYSMVLYPVIAVTYILLHHPYDFHSLTYLLGAIMIVFFCAFYFVERFNKPVSGSYRESPFWISAGLLIFYGSTIPIMAFMNYMDPNGIELTIFELVISISNYLLYFFFIVAFFCFLRFGKAQ